MQTIKDNLLAQQWNKRCGDPCAEVIHAAGLAPHQVGLGFQFFSTQTMYHICVSVDAVKVIDLPSHKEKSPLLAGFFAFGGADGTRTRDPRRDRP